MNKEIDFKELLELMEKGEAPNKIKCKKMIFKYHLYFASKEERLKDIKKNGLWNNGGYVTDDNIFLLDEIVKSKYKLKIKILDDLNEKEEKINNLHELLYNFSIESDALYRENLELKKRISKAIDYLDEHRFNKVNELKAILGGYDNRN